MLVLLSNGIDISVWLLFAVFVAAGDRQWNLFCSGVILSFVVFVVIVVVVVIFPNANTERCCFAFFSL